MHCFQKSTSSFLSSFELIFFLCFNFLLSNVLLVSLSFYFSIFIMKFLMLFCCLLLVLLVFQCVSCCFCRAPANLSRLQAAAAGAQRPGSDVAPLHGSSGEPACHQAAAPADTSDPLQLLWSVTDFYCG